MASTAAVSDTRERFSDLVGVYLPIAAAVFAVVVALLVFTALRFRSQQDDFPGGRDDSHPLEWGYAIVVGAVVALLLYLTFSTMSDEHDTLASTGASAKAPPGAEAIHVTAAQWAWRFAYRRGVVVQGDSRRVPTLVVPVGRPVHFTVTSLDVVHAFYLPERRFKVDAFPRRTTAANLRWPHPGSWREGGACNQFCGLDHATMVFHVRALPAPAYDAWLRARAPGGSA